MERVRLATQADVPAIADLYRTLSAESTRMRFSGPLPPEGADKVARLDGDALGYVIELGGRIVAEGRYLPADGDVYEFALTVADAYQRLGFGPRLLDLLRTAARERGIGSLRAIVRTDNPQMLRVLQKVGCAIVDPVRDGVAVVDVSTDDDMPGWPAHDTRPRVLVESRGMWDDDATAALRTAGFDVRRCLVAQDRPCPILERGRCRLAEEADIVACLLPPADEKSKAIADRHARAHRLAARSVHEWRESAAHLIDQE